MLFFERERIITTADPVMFNLLQSAKNRMQNHIVYFILLWMDAPINLHHFTVKEGRTVPSALFCLSGPAAELAKCSQADRDFWAMGTGTQLPPPTELWNSRVGGVTG